jgi:hypothetical protein
MSAFILVASSPKRSRGDAYDAIRLSVSAKEAVWTRVVSVKLHKARRQVETVEVKAAAATAARNGLSLLVMCDNLVALDARRFDIYKCHWSEQDSTSQIAGAHSTHLDAVWRRTRALFQVQRTTARGARVRAQIPPLIRVETSGLHPRSAVYEE